MIAYWISLYHRLVESLCRARGRLHLACLDQQSSDRCQTRVLQGLVHGARNTVFGRDHEFHRIRTATDFRRLVPLGTFADFQNPACEPGCPGRGDVTAVHKGMLKTGLALAVAGGVRVPLFSGRLLFANEESTRRLLSLPGCQRDRPLLIRPRSLAEVAPASIPFIAGPDWLDGLCRQPITGLGGSVAGLHALVRMVKEKTGHSRLSATWPDVSVALCLREDGDAAPAALKEELGQDVLLLEAIVRPEGAIALTDPRHGRLRLLTDHGLYFEFIPEAHRDQLQPERLGIDQLTAGARYELAVSSPVGLWACRTGLLVAVEQLQPLLLGTVERVPLPAPAPVPPAKAKQPAAEDTRSLTLPTRPAPLQGPHPRSAGSSAKPPETFAHNPWSAPVDRG